jgi:putative transposase
MAQTLIKLYVHVIFSTKNRANTISPEVEDSLYGYIGGILNNHQSKLLIANGTANHSHLLISLSKNVLLPDIVGSIKRDSSKHIKTIDNQFRNFQWQDGYAAFSVGHTQIGDVKRYIANQKAHHQKQAFEDEMRMFFKKYEIEYDERYVWD